MWKVALAAWVGLSSLAQAPPAFPREESLPPFPTEFAKQIFDNERVIVWEASWPKGKSFGMLQSRYDMVIVDLANASYEMALQGGTSHIFPVKFGQASFIPKGIVRTEEGISQPPRTAIVIELKGAIGPPLENKSDYPDAFPIESAQKLLENYRLTVWDYTWTRGKPTPMRFQANDAVTVYLTSGELRSNVPEGQSVVNLISPGFATFSPRNRIHSEELVKGAARAIVVELR
jgi:hypothetical protein